MSHLHILRKEKTSFGKKYFGEKALEQIFKNAIKNFSISIFKNQENSKNSSVLCDSKPSKQLHNLKHLN